MTPPSVLLDLSLLSLLLPYTSTFTPLTTLGQSSIPFPSPSSASALGTWSWGNKLLYSYNESDDANILEAYCRAREMGMTLFDTGDSYGTGKIQGNAEKLLRLGEERYIKANPNPPTKPIFLSKIAVYPWLLTTNSYYANILSSRSRLGVASSSCHFIPSLHWSPSRYLPLQKGAVYSGLLKAYETGNADAVGLSNLGPSELADAMEYFKSRSVPVACNQVQASLAVDYDADVRPAVDVAERGGVATLGYSPLALGLFAKERTGRGGARGFLFDRLGGGEGGAELLRAVKDVADRNEGTDSQVALAWVRRSGCIPLFGARGVGRVEENLKPFEIGDEDFEELEAAREGLKNKATKNIFMTS